MACVTDIRQIDADRIELLIECCIQAYNAFSKKTAAVCDRSRVMAPQGYELLDAWTGVDSVFGLDKTIETYGLVFRSTAAPWRYVFAFRGTDSALEMLDDCGVEPQPFVAFDRGIGVPASVRVESGFNDIYKAASGPHASMQQQLFALVDKYQATDKPIDELIVTGHSLGAALSQLFTLDLGLSRPSITAANINFASPRVGNKAFVRYFEQQASCSTLRVQNAYDAVPHLPPAELGFQHTPCVYLVAFYSTNLLGKIDLLANHSSINYQAVIACAGNNGTGVCSTKHLQVSAGKAPLRSQRPIARIGHLAAGHVAGPQ